jgi:hypothetical protein
VGDPLHSNSTPVHPAGRSVGHATAGASGVVASSADASAVGAAASPGSGFAAGSNEHAAIRTIARGVEPARTLQSSHD